MKYFFKNFNLPSNQWWCLWGLKKWLRWPLKILHGLINNGLAKIRLQMDKIWLRYSLARGRIFSSFWPSALAKYKNAPSVIHWKMVIVFEKNHIILVYLRLFFWLHKGLWIKIVLALDYWLLSHYLDLSTQPNEPEKLLTSNIHLLSPQN